jgi:enterobactin synthetase component D
VKPPRLLPAAFFQCCVGWPSVAPEPRQLFPDLSLPSAMTGAVKKRQTEFLAGRHCAAVSIERCRSDLGRVTVAAAADGRPLWPDGLVGSITHSAGFAWAAVARSEQARGLGIDSEVRLDDERAAALAGSILTRAELRALRAARLGDGAAVTLAFSAKESLFKCLHPLVLRPFDYLDAEVTAVVAPGELELRLLVDLGPAAPRLSTQTVAFELDGGRVHTCAVRWA